MIPYPGIYVPFLLAAAGNAIEQGLDCITTKVLAETYRRKMEASDAENPFLVDDPDPERFKVIIARMKARQAREEARFAAQRPAAARAGGMDLTK